jgi:hypothetical protein
MFQAAAQGRFKPLPNGNATFGFRDGAYWFHTRLFNRGNPEERWLLVLQYSLLDNVDVYMRYPRRARRPPRLRRQAALLRPQHPLPAAEFLGGTCRSARKWSCWCVRRAKARCRRRW